PLEDLVRHALERLAEHHETTRGVARSQVQVREPSAPPAVAPFGREHDEVEGVGPLDLQPSGTARAGFIGRVQVLGDESFVPGAYRGVEERLRLRGVSRDEVLWAPRLRNALREPVVTMSVRLRQQRRAVGVNKVEEECRERELAAPFFHVELASE